ncbi:MAG: DUF4272 domain-containing protein [Bacteroidota bacterium]
MKTCTIFSENQDLRAVYERLQERFGENAIELKGEPDKWTELTVKARRFLRKSQVTLTPLSLERADGALEERILQMRHVFSSIPAENEPIRRKLIYTIDRLQLGIEAVSDRAIRDWEEAIFGAAKALEGLVFWDGNQLLNEKGHVILDFKGRTRVEDLKVNGDFPEHSPADDPAAQARQIRNEAFLKELDIPVNPYLPPESTADSVRLPASEVVLDRALAAYVVAALGRTQKDDLAARLMRQFGVQRDMLSSTEAEFVFPPEPRDPQAEWPWFLAFRIAKSEALLWALNCFAELPYPGQDGSGGPYDDERVWKFFAEAVTRAKIGARAQFRPLEEILEQADLTLRLEWACTDAYVQKTAPPANLDPRVIYERRQAFQWLLRLEERHRVV